MNQCFAPSIALTNRQPRLHRRGRGIATCTIAPRKVETSKNFHVIPSDLPQSARPPAPPRYYSIPMVGYFLESFLGMGASATEKAVKYGEIFSSNYMIGEMVYVTDYSTIVDIFRKPSLFTIRGAYQGLEALFPGNLLSMDGPEHTAKRKMFMAAFSKNIIPCYFSSIQKRTIRFWEEVSNELTVSNRITLNEYFRRHYLANIVEMSCGIQMEGAQAEHIRKLFYSIQTGAFLTYKFGPLVKSAFEAQYELIDILKAVVLENITTRKHEIDSLRAQGEDYLRQELRGGDVNILLVLIANSTLSTAPNAVHDEKIVYELACLMMGTWLAGYAATAVVSQSSMFVMGFNSDILEELVNEQDKLVEGNDGAEDVTYEQVMKNMPLLDSFITEVIRLYPPGASLYRVSEEDIELRGHYVPKGTLINCCVLAAQMDDRIYPNAADFDMHRFSKDNKPPPTLSFGAPGSPHYCSGSVLSYMLVKTMLATLLRRYNFTLDESQSREFKYLPETSPKSGAVVNHLSKRK